VKPRWRPSRSRWAIAFGLVVAGENSRSRQPEPHQRSGDGAASALTALPRRRSLEARTLARRALLHHTHVQRSSLVALHGDGSGDAAPCPLHGAAHMLAPTRAIRCPADAAAATSRLPTPSTTLDRQSASNDPWSQDQNSRTAITQGRFDGICKACLSRTFIAGQIVEGIDLASIAPPRSFPSCAVRLLATRMICVAPPCIDRLAGRDLTARSDRWILPSISGCAPDSNSKIPWSLTLPRSGDRVQVCG